jgi:hypothetical protein
MEIAGTVAMKQLRVYNSPIQIQHCVSKVSSAQFF